jgi:phosphoribosyl 1,2-cyclic phosphate phosphodiesterase
MTITFLGTGTSHGVPMIGCTCATCASTDPHDTRLRPSIYVESGASHADGAGTKLLVDAGPDLRQQALRHRITRVDAILFTHGHADHILGIDDVRRFNALMRGPMPCYGDAATLDDIRRTFGYAFTPPAGKGGGLPQLELREVHGPFIIGDLEIRPVPVFHGDRPILGFRFGDAAYLTDCNRLADEAWGMLEGLDVLVLDALRERHHPTHFTLREAIDTATRIGATRTFFTHMCHDLSHESTNARLPAGMALAYDGLVLDCCAAPSRAEAAR